MKPAVKWIGWAAAASLALLLAGCGEDRQVIVYQQGKYQGKPDTRPWESEQSPVSLPGAWPKGNKEEWEKAVKARTGEQNEYLRVTGGH